MLSEASIYALCFIDRGDRPLDLVLSAGKSP